MLGTYPANQTSEVFLKPAQLPKGEVLQIVDFIDNIVPREDKRTLFGVETPIRS